jgi:phosphatidylglycerol:prolipoprotein diacylglycerol transferase
MSWLESSSSITFPGLGISINPPEGLLIGAFSIHFYGVIIALGLMLAVIYGLKRSKQFGLKEDDILDGVLWIVPLSIVFARAYYCVFSWDRFADNPIRVLYVWEGGIAIYGAVIGAALGVVGFSLIKKVKLGAVLDLVALGFLIGQSIGRWGNFFNREAYGAETESFLRMGLLLTPSGTQTLQMRYYHPTFLYEALWNAVGFAALHFLSKKRRYDGQIALGYAAWYGLGRTLIEGLRTDSLYWGDFRVSQLLAAISCFAAATALVVLAFRKHSPEKLYVNAVAAREALAEEQSAEAEQVEDAKTQPEAPAEEVLEEQE